jgi:septal ring factor EnvC (AmiA/AmiB activator)
MTWVKRMLPTACMAICIAGLLGSCATHPVPPADTIRKEMSALRDAIGQTVQEPERRQQALQNADRMQDELLTLEQAVYQFSIELRALNARPDAAREDFDQMLERFDAVRGERRQRIVAAHLGLLQSTTADEWKKLSSHEARAMVASVQVPQR